MVKIHKKSIICGMHSTETLKNSGTSYSFKLIILTEISSTEVQ